MTPPLAFALILDLAERRGVSSIKDLPGCWEFTAGPFAVAVNGHRTDCATSAGATVPPFHVLAVDGLRMALISPSGGTAIGGCEDELIAALQAELAR